MYPPARLTVVGLLRFLLAAVLLVSAAAKLASGRSGRDALRSYGIGSVRSRASLWTATIVAEIGIAVALAAGVPGAAEAAAVLFGVFASALALAILRGRAGAPCGCFGGRSRIGWPAFTRTALLAAGAAAVPSFPTRSRRPRPGWASALSSRSSAWPRWRSRVLALARELGELRLAVAPQAALRSTTRGRSSGGESG